MELVEAMLGVDTPKYMVVVNLATNRVGVERSAWSRGRDVEDRLAGSRGREVED